jgi:hypothetical protein
MTERKIDEARLVLGALYVTITVPKLGVVL